MSPVRHPAREQRGSVLIVSLIMLVVLTLLAVSAIRMSTVGLQVVNSMQARGEALSAAQRAIDQIISANFTNDVAAVANTYTVNIDSQKAYSVAVATPCLKHLVPIKNVALNLADPEQAKCYDTTTNPFSACADTVWQFSSSVNEGFFGANVSIVQGISIRMDNATAAGYISVATFLCPAT